MLVVSKVGDMERLKGECCENEIDLDALLELADFCNSKGFALKVVRVIPGYSIHTDMMDKTIYVCEQDCKYEYVKRFMENFGLIAPLQISGRAL